MFPDPNEPLEPKQTSAFTLRPYLFRFIRQILETVIPAVIFGFLISIFLAQSTLVHGYSMEPNLHTSQRLMIEKVSYHFQTPSRGDIVVVNIPSSEQPLIKRVVGLPGEKIEIKDNQVFIDGDRLSEPYLTSEPTSNQPGYLYHHIEIPSGHIFVMGDNRGASNDSRFFGPIHIDEVVGRAWLSYWPIADLGPLN